MKRAVTVNADFCDCCDKDVAETFDDRDPLLDDLRGHLCAACKAIVDLLDGHIGGVEFFAAYLQRYMESRTWL
jgi:hypothetical protein